MQSSPRRLPDRTIRPSSSYAAGDGDVAGMLRRLAEAGNAYIMYRLGRMYAFGTGVGRDEREAVRWYRQGAAAGNAAAMTALAAAVVEGRGTDRNPEQGLALLRAAIDKGSLEAMYAMGTITRDGKLVVRNPQEAVRLFTQAAQWWPCLGNGRPRPDVRPRQRSGGRPRQGRGVVPARGGARRFRRDGRSATSTRAARASNRTTPWPSAGIGERSPRAMPRVCTTLRSWRTQAGA
jgi:Sel1 repeat